MYPQAGVPEGGNCGGVVVATVVAPVRTCNLLPRTCVHEAFGLCFAPPGVSQGQASAPILGPRSGYCPSTRVDSGRHGGRALRSPAHREQAQCRSQDSVSSSLSPADRMVTSVEQKRSL